MTGDEDEPCLEASLLMKRAIRRAGLAIFPRSGHPINLEEPALFNQLLETFFHQVESGQYRMRDPRAAPGDRTAERVCQEPKMTAAALHEISQISDPASTALAAGRRVLRIEAEALEALAAVLGGTQSLHTNAFDEALALPTEHSATIALRTQQVIGYETGVTETVDPVAGSYYVESLTDELERLATEYIGKIDAVGGAVHAIEAGFYQDEIHEAAFRIQQGIESGERVVVGVNRFVDAEEQPVELQRISEAEVSRQVERVRTLRTERDQRSVDAALAEVGETARGTGNLLPPMKEALRARATLGEVSDALRGVFGEYRPTY